MVSVTVSAWRHSLGEPGLIAARNPRRDEAQFGLAGGRHPDFYGAGVSGMFTAPAGL
jgi:hypothetical protein